MVSDYGCDCSNGEERDRNFFCSRRPRLSLWVCRSQKLTRVAEVVHPFVAGPVERELAGACREWRGEGSGEG